MRRALDVLGDYADALAFTWPTLVIVTCVVTR